MAFFWSYDALFISTTQPCFLWNFMLRQTICKQWCAYVFIKFEYYFVPCIYFQCTIFFMYTSCYIWKFIIFFSKKRPVFNYIMIYLDSPQEQMQGTDSRKSNQYSIRHYNWKIRLSVYKTILVIIYILVIAAYIFLIITLIKKDIYNPSSSKKLAGGWCITSFVLLGMGVAKVLSSSVEYTAMIRIASLCSYFCSLGSILGVFHLVKYFAVKKWEVEKWIFLWKEYRWK